MNRERDRPDQRVAEPTRSQKPQEVGAAEGVNALSS